MYQNISKYAYAVGRIRVLETRLLSKSNLERLLATKTEQDALKIIQESGYNNAGENNSKPSFQDLVDWDLRESKELINKMAPSQNIIELLWMYYDIHNIKLLLRAKHTQLSQSIIESNVIRLGSTSHNVLEKYIFEKSYEKEVPEYLKNIIGQAEELYQKEDNIELVDNFLDSSYFSHAKKVSKDLKNPFIKNFYNLLIDIYNIKTAIRLKKRDVNNDIVSVLFTFTENLDKSFFEMYQEIDSFDKANEMLLTKLHDIQLHEAIKKGLTYLNEHSSFLKLEIEFENLLTDHMMKAKRIPLGPEPLFAYFWAKRNNAQVIRTVMVGKRNDVDTQVIKQRLCHLFQ